MKRMFLPVGQGAFYCEKFTKEDSGKEINIIYDCGSSSGEEYVKREVDKHFKPDEIIDALFIIGCVQIPHHGSEYNFNNAFLQMDAYSVISAGLGNPYRHPSNTVLAKYRQRNQFPFVVTQDPRSLFCTTVQV